MYVNSEDIKIEECETLGISNRDIGLYEESIIINYTPHRIVVLDAMGGTRVVEPHPTNQASDFIKVIHRKHNGVRYQDNNGRSNAAVPIEAKIPSVKYEIRSWRIQKGPVHIQSLNLVLGVEGDPNLLHPNRVTPYVEGLAKASERITAEETSAVLRFYVNDPTGDIEHVWLTIDGTPVQVAATSEHEPSGHITLGLTVSRGSEHHIQKRINIDRLKDDEYLNVTDLFDYPITLGLTREGAEIAYKVAQKAIKAEVASSVTKLVEVERKELKETLELSKRNNDKIKVMHESEVVSLKAVTVKLQGDYDQLNMDYQHVKKLRDEWKQMYEAQCDSKVAESKVDQESHKTERAILALEQEKAKIEQENAKFKGNMIKLAVGTAVSVGIMILGVLLKRK